MAQRRTATKRQETATDAAPRRVADAARPTDAAATARAVPSRTVVPSGRPPKPAAVQARPAKPVAPSSRPPKPATAESRPPKPDAPAGRPAKPTERTQTVPKTGARGALESRTQGLRRLYDDTLSEMRKVNWPDRETTKNLTLVVIAVSVVLGILLGGVDFALQALFEVLP